MSGKLFLLKFVVRQLDLGRSIFAPVTGVLLAGSSFAEESCLLCVSPKLGRSIFGKRAEREISVKKRRLFDCFKNAQHPF